ncbi:Non-specific serine/threonine protein kinase [Sulfidibacter corallicola]|uniref:Serine/threonine protein kinase n=1 Tax=Sulfidibacter corallicola TaxID=2818388 RepID=A0A8A4TI76_SULCO|nr:serine/threonine-protein kinase [Sulfidibacter corallicola]QTD49197.1 serine/threonine protein kinase [Sulfidibacter corallicola]
MTTLDHPKNFASLDWTPRAVKVVSEEAWDGQTFGRISQIGPYRVTRELGQGGTGLVLLATRDDDTRKQVAIKVLKRGMDTVDILRRFYQERKILAALSHTNIAQLYDAGTTDSGLPFFVMEYVDGVPIDQYADRQGLSVGDRLKLFQKVCGAVSFAHQNLVIHRDLKPANILVTSDGEPKLLDFGISGLLDPETMTPKTATVLDERMLTLEYASPEQLRGERLGTGSDVYSLGVILYQLLTGNRPFYFPGRDPMEAESRIAKTRPLKPSDAVQRRLIIQTGKTQAKRGWRFWQRSNTARLNRGLVSDVDNIVLKTLAYEPRDRYPSVEHLTADIRRYFLGLPIHARPLSMSYRLAKFWSRNRWTFVTVGLFCGLLIGFSAFALHLARQTEEERDTAEEVVNFMVELFSINDPDLARGQTVTAKELLDKGAERIANDLKDQPRARANLLSAMGRAYAGLGLYHEAQPLLEIALEDRRKAFGLDSLELARAYYDVGNAYFDTRMYDSVLPYYTEALRIFTQRLGPDHDQVLEVRNQIGYLYQCLGNYDLAEQYYRDVYEIRSRVLGDDHPSFFHSLNALGIIYMVSNKNEEALDAFSRVLEHNRKEYGPLARNTIAVTGNLALTYYQIGQYDKAISLYRRQLEGSRKIYDNNHPYLSAALQFLGNALRANGEYEEAQQLLEESVEVLKRTMASNEPSFATANRILGRLHHDRGNWEKAENLYREALSVALNSYGEGHYLVARVQMNLGELLLDQGHPDQAEHILRQALASFQSQFSDNYFRTANTRSVLGASLAAQGRLKEAGPLLKDSYERLREVNGEGEFTRKARVRLQIFESQLEEAPNKM